MPGTMSGKQQGDKAISFHDKLFGHDVGIDLGDGNARVWVKGKGIVLVEPVDGARRMQMGAWKSDEQDAAVKLFGKCLSVVPKSLFGPRVFLAVSADLSLTGSEALCPGLDKRIAEATGLPVHIAEEPATATIRGLGEYIDLYEELMAMARKRQADERKRQSDQYAAELRRRERLNATSTLLMPDGRDFLTWSREIENRISGLEAFGAKWDSIDDKLASITARRASEGNIEQQGDNR